MKATLVLAAAPLGAHAFPAAADDQVADRAVPFSDHTVFVDPPTGFVCVLLPGGWKFVDRVGEQDVAASPPQVVTALLAPQPAELGGAGSAELAPPMP